MRHSHSANLLRALDPTEAISRLVSVTYIVKSACQIVITGRCTHRSVDL